MAQLWLSLRAMLLAALEDREAAHASAAIAHAAAATVREEVDRVQILQEDERVALRAISERHAAKAETAQQQMEEYRQKCQKVSSTSCFGGFLSLSHAAYCFQVAHCAFPATLSGRAMSLVSS